MANETFKELRDKVNELEEKNQDVLDELDSERLKRLELGNKLTELEKKLGEELPPHFHKLDRINQLDIVGGLNTFNATPTHVSEESKPIIYTVNSTSFFLGVKINNEWRKVELTTIT